MESELAKASRSEWWKSAGGDCEVASFFLRLDLEEGGGE